MQEATFITNGYMSAGETRHFHEGAPVFLIGDYLYAKDTQRAKICPNPLSGELHGYVRVNEIIVPTGSPVYQEVCDKAHHTPYRESLG